MVTHSEMRKIIKDRERIGGEIELMLHCVDAIKEDIGCYRSVVEKEQCLVVELVDADLAVEYLEKAQKSLATARNLMSGSFYYKG